MINKIIGKNIHKSFKKDIGIECHKLLKKKHIVYDVQLFSYFNNIYDIRVYLKNKTKRKYVDVMIISLEVDDVFNIKKSRIIEKKKQVFGELIE